MTLLQALVILFALLESEQSQPKAGLREVALGAAEQNKVCAVPWLLRAASQQATQRPPTSALTQACFWSSLLCACLTQEQASALGNFFKQARSQSAGALARPSSKEQLPEGACRLSSAKNAIICLHH